MDGGSNSRLEDFFKTFWGEVGAAVEMNVIGRFL